MFGEQLSACICSCGTGDCLLVMVNLNAKVCNMAVEGIIVGYGEPNIVYKNSEQFAEFVLIKDL